MKKKMVEMHNEVMKMLEKITSTKHQVKKIKKDSSESSSSNDWSDHETNPVGFGDGR